MPMTYRRPGVYLEESLLVNPAEVSGAITVAAFVGAASQGPIGEPVLIEAWSDYVSMYGGFGAFPVPDDTTAPAGEQAQPKALSYLPYAVYSFFQSGGRTAYIIRAAPTASGKKGETATSTVNGMNDTPDWLPADPTPDEEAAALRSFIVNAKSVGEWGNTVEYSITRQNSETDAEGNPQESVFAIQVILVNAENNKEVVETWPGLSVTGEMSGTRKVDSKINDIYSGSQYITITGVNPRQPDPQATESNTALTGGVNPALPIEGELQGAAAQLSKVEGPIALNIVGYLNDASTADTADAPEHWVSTTTPASFFPDRQDIFIINDNAPPRIPGQSSSSYKSLIQNTGALGTNLGDSYSASYGPWIITPNPQKVGETISVPPGGGVLGVYSRIDATIGVFRAPAGVIAGISNAVGVQCKFTDTELGDLNAQNINIIRSVVGAGIAIMGARTRKSFGADRYVSPRRTLIYLKEVLKRSTQFAVFENNDERLWAALRMSADRILRPLWEAGGLRGNNPSEAYYIRCDATLNTSAVIQSGEVRMEVGVALEYPAEFVVIRVTQFDRATFTSEVLPVA